uniref:Uncharacterized protein n=1 Tax=Anguilla anguilla TaxID=7936 RepID=A0A0E9QAS9_ANGAN
MFRIERSLQEA